MNNWTDIKKKILFSYIGCDWISIRIPCSNVQQIKNILNDIVAVNGKDSIYTFEIARAEICFYTSSETHFDFDPKQITSLEQWTVFLDFFKEMSKELNADILFRPEDSDYESSESILIRISGDNVSYNFDIKGEYNDDEIYSE